MEKDTKKIDDLAVDSASAGSEWGELAMIVKGLELNGFRLSRGTCKATVQDWATLDIDRPDTPEWQGVWQAVESDGEIGTVIRLIGQAIEEWYEYQDLIQNKLKV